MTDPIPPLDASEIDSAGGSRKITCDFAPVDKSRALDFLRTEGVRPEDISPVSVGGNLVGFQCSKTVTPATKADNRYYQGAKLVLNFYIPVVSNSKAEESKTGSEALPAPSFIAKESLLDGFNRMARLSRYIVEYVLWVFSRWHHEKRGRLTDPQYIKRFAEEKFRVVDRHEYPERIPRRLDPNLGGLLSGGKIIVPSTDVRNRLVYALQIQLTQNYKEVLNYYSKTYIKNYYMDVTDFDLQDNTILLFGPEMVLNWINSRLPHYVLQDRVTHPCAPSKPGGAKNKKTADPDEKDEKDEKDADEPDESVTQCILAEKPTDPYFLRLENLDNEIFLAQPARDLPHALYICKVWKEQEWNVGYADPGISDTRAPFRYVAYNDAYDYDVENVGGDPGIDPKTVLQYKLGGEIYTLALLPYDM
jgi:hypothetical protein